MSSDQQIEKLKGHIQIFSEELQALIQSFELLRVMAEDQKLIKRISGTKRARGFSVNRWSLIQECILGITKLTYDSQPQTPTLKKLIGDILKAEADDLREKLKALFAWHTRVPPPLRVVATWPLHRGVPAGPEVHHCRLAQMRQKPVSHAADDPPWT